ncbi:MAG: hypothetical protein CO093_03445 [Alphaproteobacteria bacterium CG_4_9_14_3_um_filter_47_13]|nr:MAG: hypothetical protein CO093_03445 [Alphaproteobacteria bacterium CG_4_9_14_3_um_filter_47_13]
MSEFHLSNMSDFLGPPLTVIQTATELGFNNSNIWFRDGIFHYKLTLENYSGDTLKLGFGSDLNQSLSDESWGIDNLKIESVHNITLVSQETFESGASGWNNNTVDSSEANFTSFLGRRGGSAGQQSLYKTFDLPGQEHIVIEFDFYKIDSWDGEHFGIFINDTQILNHTFYSTTSSGTGTGAFSGGTYEKTVIQTATELGFNSNNIWFRDGIFHYKLTLENYSGGTLKLGFGSDLDQSLSDESWGIDNVTVTAIAPAMDSLHGGAGNDTLHGGEGSDFLYGDDGMDILYGGAGSDVFVFEKNSAFNNIDRIEDFSIAEGDALDISDILDGYTPGVDSITNFVRITDNGTDSLLAINQDGTGNTGNFYTIATISGAIGMTDESALVSNGSLIVT